MHGGMHLTSKKTLKMKTVSISGSPRANVGKKDAQELRRKELVPCVIYGGKEQVHFSAPEKQFKHLVYTPEVNLVKLDVGGKEYNAILHDIQFHRLSDKIIHVDFMEIVPGKPVTMNIPVKTKGNSEGVKAGGKLLKKMRTLKVRGVAEKMPDEITFDVTNLNIGDSIKVSDVKLDGLSVMDEPTSTIVAVRVTRNVAEETPAAGAAAPAAGAAAPAAGAAAPAAAGAKPAAEAKK